MSKQSNRSGHSSGDGTVVGKGQTLRDIQPDRQQDFIWMRIGDILKIPLFVVLSAVKT